MSFYTIDGRFVNKKKVIEGFPIFNPETNINDTGNNTTNNTTIDSNTNVNSNTANNTDQSMDIISSDNSKVITRDMQMGDDQDMQDQDMQDQDMQDQDDTYKVDDSIISLASNAMSNTDDTSNVKLTDASAKSLASNDINNNTTDNTSNIKTSIDDQDMEEEKLNFLDELKPPNDDDMYMNFCINNKCLTGTELRKLNELYDKKCNQ